MLLRNCTAIALLLLLLMCVTASAAEIPANPENFHLYLLIGQSNMAGRGKVADEDRQPHPRVFCFNKQQEWVPAVDPLHFDKPVAGVGLGKTFGSIIAEQDPDVVIGLIPCAVGGSPIASWEPGGYHEQTKSHPYDDMLKRCRVALPTGQLKGILWHQGESDSNASTAPLYEAKLRKLWGRLREALHAEEVPILIGQLGQFAGIPWSEYRTMVDAAHRKIAAESPRVGFVSSEGLEHKGDKVHFSAEAYREFGKRYAQEYLKMVEP